MQNWLTKWVNKIFVIWLLLTIAILINNSFFYINEYISHPQHGQFEELVFVNISQIIETEGKMTPYVLFFILDAFWALSLIILIAIVIRSLTEDVLFAVMGKKYNLYNIYLTFAIFGYICDLIEGLLYILFDPLGLVIISKLKVLFYAVALLCFVYWLLQKYLIPNLKDFLRFVETSLLSLVFILLVYGLVSLMPQGGTLVVEMFNSGGNIILFFGLLTFLTIIISHYPVYVDIWRYGNNKCVKLGMPKKPKPILGFNIIYYYPVKKFPEEEQKFNRPLVKKMRRSLGILLYVAIFNIFLGVGGRFFEVNINATAVSVAILVVTLIIYNRYGKRYDNWKEILSNGEYTEEEQRKTVQLIVRYVRFFPWYFMISTVFVFITAAFAQAESFGWSRITLVLSLITLGLQMFLYVYFKICRTYFKYVFFYPKMQENKPEMFRKNTK
ncbi:MAG: hypothetical protein HKN48_03785, partial [Flavobacteriaceae bacterium]|nr:hypothetical protein [Flavobacteriaceae bacterium]